MSFFASNNRIRVTDGSETVFDTNEDMPHIIGTAYVSNVAVNYSNIGTTQVFYFSGQNCFPNLPSCSPNPPNCSPNPPYCVTSFCSYNYYWGVYDCPPPTCFSNSPFCLVTPPFCVAVPDFCIPFIVTQPQYVASEFSADINLVDLPTDEDGGVVPIDFVVIQASGSRTTAGLDARLETSFLSTVPSGTFSFQGSTLLESSSRDNGTSWFRRIMSVFINNNTGKLVLRRQESVSTRVTEGKAAGSEASTFSFNFKIFFGRFKS